MRQHYELLTRGYAQDRSEEVLSQLWPWLLPRVEGTDLRADIDDGNVDVSTLQPADAGFTSNFISRIISGPSRFGDLAAEEIKDHLFYADYPYANEYSDERKLNPELCSKIRFIKECMPQIIDDTWKNTDLLSAIEYWLLHHLEPPEEPTGIDWLVFAEWLESHVTADSVSHEGNTLGAIEAWPASGTDIDPRLIRALSLDKHRFAELETWELSIYLNLSNSIESDSAVPPITRHDQEILLCGDQDRIVDFLYTKVGALDTYQEQSEQEDKIEQFLKRVLASPIERVSADHRRSATIALDKLSRRTFKDFEPETIWIPTGGFLMGRGLAEAKFWEAQNHEEASLTTLLQDSDILLPDYFPSPVSTTSEALNDLRYPDECPQHFVKLQSYRISRYPVTNIEYKAFVDATEREAPSTWPDRSYPSGEEHFPVAGVTWEDANSYCRWLAEKTGNDYRLPTEAEWEKAARGTDGRVFPWGNQWDPRLANTKESAVGRTSEVGSYSPGGDSPYGIADMAGNVAEWCEDVYDPKIYGERAKGEVIDPENRVGQGPRVLRGGSFSDSVDVSRCSYRRNTSEISDCGFRVVISMRDRRKQLRAERRAARSTS